MFPRPVLYTDLDGYAIKPHPDTRRKVLTMQIYLPADDTQRELGTTIYKISPMGIFAWKSYGLAKEKTLPFLPNTGYAFVVIHPAYSLFRASWHGREAIRVPVKKPRLSILNTYYREPAGAGGMWGRERDPPAIDLRESHILDGGRSPSPACRSLLGKVAEGRMGCGRLPQCWPDCRSVDVNLRRAIPAFRTPSGPPGPLPHFVEKGSGSHRPAPHTDLLPAPRLSAPPLRRRAAGRFVALGDDAAAGDQRSRPVHLDDHAAQAEVDAHGAGEPVGQSGGRIGDAPAVRLDGAIDLAPQARQRACALRPRGEKFFRKLRVQAYGDFRQICLLWLVTNERTLHAGARFIQKQQGEEAFRPCVFIT